MIKEEWTVDELQGMSIEDLREELSEKTMRLKALGDAKKLYTSSLNEMIKAEKVKLGNILEVLEAKDSDTSRRVTVEVSRQSK